MYTYQDCQISTLKVFQSDLNVVKDDVAKIASEHGVSA